MFVCGSLDCPLRLVVVVREGGAERRISFLGVMDGCPGLCFFCGFEGLWVYVFQVARWRSPGGPTLATHPSWQPTPLATHPSNPPPATHPQRPRPRLYRLLSRVRYLAVSKNKLSLLSCVCLSKNISFLLRSSSFANPAFVLPIFVDKQMQG